MGKSYEGTGIEELVRVIDRCVIGVAFTEGVLWRAGTDPVGNWRSWQTLQFEPLILPHLAEVVDLAVRHSLREIVFLDQALQQLLGSSISHRSQIAAERLLQARPPKGDRMVARLQEAIRAGETPGHFVTLFAVRAVFDSRSLDHLCLYFVRTDARASRSGPDRELVYRGRQNRK
jgi:hypothetical protein